ncbi:MAG TPA: dTMP kinase [Mariprofundaceae bacterium]|nr:dTMP kinase [Mariprofundaceae bacterium]
MNGRLVTFEGVDGCGKSTQQKLTAEWLRNRGMEVLTTFEPGDTPLGAEIRKLLLSGAHQPVAAAELLLFLADRAQHVHEVIRPALDAGDWVLCDRYTDSTRAYQLAGRNLDAASVEQLLDFAELGVHPALTVWLDLPVQTSLERIRSRAGMEGGMTRLDEECRSFHEAVSAGFEQMCRDEPERVLRIDATGTVANVQQRIRTAICDVMGWKE